MECKDFDFNAISWDIAKSGSWEGYCPCCPGTGHHLTGDGPDIDEYPCSTCSEIGTYYLTDDRRHRI
jgi:hypothetical protein